MNYQSHYDRLIARARGRTLGGYRERHHVVPKCMGGGNEPTNIVELTAEEHYVAHQLLVKIYPKVRGLVLAAVRMARQCTGNKAYGWLRRRHAKAMSLMPSPTKGRPFTAEHRARLSEAHKGKKQSPELIAKRMAAITRRPLSMEARARIGEKNSKRFKGVKRGPLSPEQRAARVPPRLGMTNSLEHRQKISEAHRGKKRSPEHRANIAAAMRRRVVKPESIAKTAAARRGMKHTPEARAKMSAALRGRKNGPPSAETREKIASALKALWARGEGKNKWTQPGIHNHATQNP